MYSKFMTLGKKNFIQKIKQVGPIGFKIRNGIH